LTANLPAAAKGQWIFRIEASQHDAKVAYLAVDAHRMGNYAPLVYRTEDSGKTWQSIASNLAADDVVKVVREDPKNPNLLFAGTEFGLYVSLNRGGKWVRFGGLPTVAVDDLMIHPRDRDLVIATHGRSLYIVDDIRPFEELTSEVAQNEAHIFTPAPAYGIYPLPGSADWTGKADFRGENPPEGVTLNFWLKSFSGEPVEIKISNAADQPVAKFKLAGTPGVNRFNWDLRPTKDLLTEYGGEGQKFVRPGEYTVTLKCGKATATQKVKVEIAPGLETR
jgi:hypothetical protein